MAARKNTPTPQTFEIVAQLADRQSGLMMSGRGDRLLVELELFDLQAAVGLVGFAALAGKPFVVTVRALTEEEVEEERNHGSRPTQ